MSDADRFPDRRTRRNPYVEPSENEGECDRCGQWSRALRDALCFGCHAHECRVQPPRVASESRATPGLHVTPGDAWNPVGAMMLRQRQRIAEQERGWKPRSDADVVDAGACDCDDCLARRRAAKRRDRSRA